jgi:hypothetical protein
LPAFFRQEIEANALGNPHALSLKSRSMTKLWNNAMKQHDWASENPNIYLRELEDREFSILRYLQALMNSEKMGSYQLHASTQAAIALLGFIKSKKTPSRTKTIANHHKTFRYVWGLAKKFYASPLSTFVFSTIGNSILSPAFEHAKFDIIIIDETTNIAESQTFACLESDQLMLGITPSKLRI